MRVDFGHFGRFWEIFGHYGLVGGPGGSGQMADRAGKGQLRAWHGPGRGQGPRSERARGRILAILGRFGTFLGPCPESERFGNGSGTSQKDGSKPGDFSQDLDGRAILGSKI